ncbi:MAG TPA: shikimate kinase [Casimicrobiaceae bacterium]|jgi:shikimate kinase|nr:shikimate kinase [Casimicrobiaceae bacterium]HET9747735.1 shikimate kinase [Casimicrobiaceae bacterium]
MSLHRGNLFLVGLMGAGKTTLGRQLARRLDRPFVDADHELEARLGVPIPTIFELEGEAGFRDREEALIGELAMRTNIVLATGGGAVMRERNRLCLRENGTVLYLHAEPEMLWQRLRNSKHRPMLHAGDPRQRLVELYRLRDPLYREVADHVIDSEREAVIRFVRWLAAEEHPGATTTDATQRDEALPHPADGEEALPLPAQRGERWSEGR